MESFLTVSELSEILKVSEPWVYKLVRQQRIPFTRVAGKAVRFRESDIEGWLEESNGKRYFRDKSRGDPGESRKKEGVSSCSQNKGAEIDYTKTKSI